MAHVLVLRVTGVNKSVLRIMRLGFKVVKMALMMAVMVVMVMMVTVVMRNFSTVFGIGIELFVIVMMPGHWR